MFRGLATIAFSVLSLLLGSCSDAGTDKAPLILAASSMQDALEEAADVWAEDGHDLPILSFAGTASLARQIEAGAPADMFVSADAEWMDEIYRKDLIVPGSRAVLAGNELALIAKADNTIDLSIQSGFGLRTALEGGRLAMADPDGVPAGRYARQALTSLEVWIDVEPRITRTDSVRAALALVTRGEAPLGIVYRSDAISEPGVRIVGIFPQASHVPIIYPIAILATSQARDTANFRSFLLSDKGQDILVKNGFTPAPVR